MAYGFSTSGSTPSFGSTAAPVSPLGIGSTPQSKALSNAQAPNMSTVNGPRYAPPPTIPAPTTPVKKTTINNVDGSSHTTEYHAPPTGQTVSSGLLNNSGQSITHAGGSPVPTGGAQGTPQTSSAPITPPQPSTPPTPTVGTTDASGNPSYQGLINAGATAAQGNEGIAKKAEDIRNLYQGQISDVGNLGAGAVAGDKSTGTNVVGEGNAAIASQSASSRMQALAADEQQALSALNPQLTAQSQEQTGLINAGTAVNPGNAFLQVPYSNQVIGADGKPINGGTTGALPQQAQDFVNSLAQQVQSGAMTRADAESRLTSYGQPGLQALNTALGSSFNTNASNASAATTATGQQIAAAIPPANQALDALQQAFDGLNALQKGSTPFGNVPILGQLAQDASMQFGPGREAASAFQGALKEARSRIDGALAGVIGVDAASAQAAALLPDNMIPSEIPQKIAAAKQYLQNQLISYTQSGQQGSSNSNTNAQSTGPITWDSIVK